MKMKTKKILAIILTVAMVLSLLTQSVWAEELFTEPEQAPAAETTFDWTGTGAGDVGIAPMSLLPLEMYSVDVNIDRTVKMPYDLVGEPRYTVYVSELLSEALQKFGITDPPANVAYSASGSESSYRLIGWNDKINLNYSGTSTYYFITGDDQFNPDNKRLKVRVSLVDTYYGTYSLDLTKNPPENFTPGEYVPVTYGEILTPTLVSCGIIPEGGEYVGKVQREFIEYDYVTGRNVSVWKDVLLTDNFDYTGSTTLDFTFDNGLKTDQSFKRVRLNFNYDDPYLEFVRSLNYSVKNADGKVVSDNSRMSVSVTVDHDTQKAVRHVNLSASAYEFENNAAPYISLIYNSYNGSQVSVYSGLHYDVSELVPEQDITEAVTGESRKALEYVEAYQYGSSAAVWGLPVTYAVTLENGSSFCVPSEIYVNLYENSASVYSYESTMAFYSSKELFPYEGPNVYPANYLGRYNYDFATDINDLYIPLRASYTNYVMNAEGSIISGVSNVTASYQGHYDTIPSDAQDITEVLFHVNYNTDYYSPDFSEAEEIGTVYSPTYDSEMNIDWEEWQLVSFEFSIFDIYGKVHHPKFVCAYKITDTAPADPYIPSGSTGFEISYLAKEPDERGYGVPRYDIRDISIYDSYYSNGYRTYLVEDNEGELTDGTVVYPYFDTADENTAVYLRTESDTESDSEFVAVLQETGKSPITFENNKTWNYSASSERHMETENYFVTFINAYKGGPKLFVNGAKCEDTFNEEGNPTREILFNNIYTNYSNEHNIIIANVGDESLKGISVKLSDDARGVKLDPYWTVTEGSVATLAPFDGIYSEYYAKDENGDYMKDENGQQIPLNGFLQNVAMIKLLPEDKTYTGDVIINYDSEGNPVYGEMEIPGFADISGTLTISAEGGEQVDIELTGITGVPKIITNEIRNGVKYVPYSSLIQTNCMYGNDNMKFTLLPGSELPDGIELMPNGELYGIPKEAGTFTISVSAEYTGNIPKKHDKSEYTDYHVYTFTIEDNTDENVDAVNTDDQGYELTDRVSKYVTIYYTSLDANGLPVIDRVEIDSDLFRSEGSYTGEFRAFYIDGIELAEGVDYTAEEGSTKITVLAETFSHIGISDKDIAHTLAAEFRNEESELKRSAQNVYLDYIEQNNQNPTPGTGGTTPGGTTPGWQNPPAGNTGSQLPSFEAVAVKVKVVDTNGDPVPGLNLELHSVVKYATTGADGTAVFDSVEFGRHTLYVMNSALSFGPSKTFTIVSGFGTALDGNILTAEIGQTIELTVEYSGNSLTLLEAKSEVEIPQEGTAQDTDGESSEEKEEEASDSAEPKEEKPSETEPSDNPATGIAFGFAALVLAAVVAVAAKKK